MKIYNDKLSLPPNPYPPREALICRRIITRISAICHWLYWSLWEVKMYFPFLVIKWKTATPSNMLNQNEQLEKGKYYNDISCIKLRTVAPHMYISSNMSFWYVLSKYHNILILIVFGKNVPKVTYFIHGPELWLWPSVIFFCKLGMPSGTICLEDCLPFCQQIVPDCYAFELVFLNIMLSIITNQCCHVPASFSKLPPSNFKNSFVGHESKSHNY